MLTFYRKGTNVFADYDILHQCQAFERLEAYTDEHIWSRDNIKLFDGYEENQRAVAKENS